MRTQSKGPAERGIVLLLALVALLLISAVAASLLYMTATESTVVGYQRSNTRVFTPPPGLPTPANPFYDWEYAREWGAGALAAATLVNPTPPPATPLSSDMVGLAGRVTLPEMQYKWVRATILTEQAANRDINGDGILDSAIPVTWDSATNRMNL